MACVGGQHLPDVLLLAFRSLRSAFWAGGSESAALIRHLPALIQLVTEGMGAHVLNRASLTVCRGRVRLFQRDYFSCAVERLLNMVSACLCVCACTWVSARY